MQVSLHLYPFLAHSLLSLASLLLSSLLSLPSLPLVSLHTYLHPDHLPSNSSPQAILNPRGGPPPKSKNKSRSTSDPFSSPSSQLLRLSLSPSLLLQKPFFPLLRLSLLSSTTSLLLLLLPSSSILNLHSPIPFLSLLLSSLLLISSLSLSSLSSPSGHRLLAVLAFPLTFPLVLHLCPTPFRVSLTATCSILAAALLFPATRAARAFWVGTDQLRLGLEVVRCGAVGRTAMYGAIVASCFASAAGFGAATSSATASAVAFTATWHLLLMRRSVQMYLNEGVLCWYQRLHGGKVPDLDYGRAKVFLHDRFLCLVALQFFAPHALALLLAGASWMDDGFFDALLWFSGGAGGGPAPILRESCLFVAWWIVFIWTIFVIFTLALLRCGFLFIS